MNPITTAAQALTGLLRAAEDGDLPMPFSAMVSGYAPHGHPADDEDPGQGGVSLGVDTLAQLAEWAIWLDNSIEDLRTSAKHRHHNVYGYAGPTPVNVYCLTLLSAEVSA